MKIFLSLFLIFFISAFAFSQTLISVDLPDFGSVKYWHHNDTLSVVSTEAGNLYIRQRHSSEWIRVQESFHLIHGVSISNTNIIVVAETPNNPTSSGILYTNDLGQTWNQLRPMSVFGNGVGYQNFKSTLNQFFFTWGSGDVKRYNYSSSAVTTLTDATTNIVDTYGLNIIGNNVYRYVNVNSNNIINYSTYRGSFQGNLQPMYYVPGQTQNITYSDGTYQMIVDRSVKKIYTRGPGIPGSHFEYPINIIGNLTDFDLICRNGVFYIKFKSGTIIYLYYSVNGIDFNVASFSNNFPDFKLVEVLPDSRLMVNSSTLLVFNLQTQSFSTFDSGMKEAAVSDVSMNDYGDLILNCKGIVYTRMADDTAYTPHLSSSEMNEIERVHVSNSRTFYAFGPTYIAKRKTITDNEFTSINFPVSNIKIAFAKQDSIMGCADDGAYRSFNGGNQFLPTQNLPFPGPYTSAISLASGVNEKNILYRQFNTSGNTGFLRTHDFGNTWQLALNFPITGYDESTMFAIDDSVIYYSEFIPNSTQENIIKLNNDGSSVLLNTLTRPTNEAIKQKGIWVENNDLYVSEVIYSQGAYHLVIKKSNNIIEPFSNIAQTSISNNIDSANSITYSNYFTTKICGNHKFFGGITNALYRLTTSIDSSFLLVSGKVFYDFNNNNLFDSGDVPANGMLIQSNSGVNTSASLTGDYQYSVTNSNTILSISPSPGYTSFPAQQIVNAGNTNMDFAMQISSSVNDLSVIHNFNAAYINQVSFFPVTITCKNEGTTALGGILKFFLNTDVTYSILNYNPMPDMISGDTLIWNLPDMLPQQVHTYQFSIDISSNPIAGTPLFLNSYIISNNTNEINLANNYFSSSYNFGILQDFTHKQVIPEEYNTQQLIDNDYINYTIYFRNYGPGTAFNIVLTDTLSELLNTASFTFVASSHPNFISQIENNILKVTYPAINLPDSTSNSNSNNYTGFYRFKIKPIQGWNSSDIIYNNAHLEFDNNNAISTQTVSTYQPIITSLNETNETHFSIYPNPAQRLVVVIGIQKNENLFLFNSIGQKVESYNIQNPQQIIALPHLTPGLYYIGNTMGYKKLMIK